MRLVSLLLPMLLIGFAAGGLRAAGRRAREPRTRTILTAAWIALVLLGPPLWLLLAGGAGP